MAKLQPLILTLQGVDRLSGTLAKVQRRLNAFSQSAKRLHVLPIGRILTLAGVAAGAAAVGGMAKFVAAGDELVKTSDRIGLTVERLQELRFVADRSGVAAGKLTSSLQAFSKRLGEARKGQGALFTLLRRTNPQLLRQLIHTEDTSKALDLFFEAIGRATTAQDRAALAAAGFSRAGIDLVTMAEGGIEGLNALAREARELGFILDRDTLEKAVAVEDRFTDLTTIMKGIGTVIAGAVLPQVEELVTSLTAWARANRDLIRQRAAEVATALAKALSLTIDAVRTGIRWFRVAIDAIGGIEVAAGIAAGVIAGQLLLSLAALPAALAFLVTPAGLFLAATAAIGAAAGLVVKHWTPIRAFFVDLWSTVVKATEAALAKLQKVIERITQVITAPLSALQDALPEGLLTALGPGRELPGTRQTAAAAAGNPATGGAREVNASATVRLELPPGVKARTEKLSSGGRDFNLLLETGGVLLGN